MTEKERKQSKRRKRAGNLGVTRKAAELDFRMIRAREN